MTIDSAWVEILKGLVPGAFSLEPPFVPECVFIDGMLLLMKAKHIRSWDQLIDFNFCRHIRKYMNMGATTVVVGFDVYYHVPTSKSITQVRTCRMKQWHRKASHKKKAEKHLLAQVNRAKAKAQVDFEESTNLPPLIPDNYEDCMSNRAFKIKVITKVVESLESMLDLPTGKRLVIDYQNYPVVSERFYRRGEVMEPVPGSRDGAKRPTIFRYMVQDVPDMGECDIKAWRWADMMGDCYAHSKDGDYIPISLIHFEKAVRRGCKPPKMAIVRGEYVSPTSRKEAGDKKNGRKNVEYVDVSKLYEGVRAFLLSRTVPACARQECSRRADVCMQALVVLIGLGGTDFSRTLPRLVPPPPPPRALQQQNCLLCFLSAFLQWQDWSEDPLEDHHRRSGSVLGARVEHRCRVRMWPGHHASRRRVPGEDPPLGLPEACDVQDDQTHFERGG